MPNAIGRAGFGALHSVDLQRLALTDPEAAQVGFNISQLWNADGQVLRLGPRELLAATHDAQANGFYAATGGHAYALWYASVLTRLHAHAQLGAPLDGPRETIKIPIADGAVQVKATDPSGASRAVVGHAREVVEGLARAEAWRPLLARTTIQISAPGTGLDALYQPSFANYEGVAYPTGQPGDPQLEVGIRFDSVERWNEGLVHELLHLWMHEVRIDDPAHGAAMDEALAKLVVRYRPTQDPDHFIIYLAQYSLSGNRALVRSELEARGAKDVADFIDDFIPHADVATRPVSADVVRAAVDRHFKSDAALPAVPGLPPAKEQERRLLVEAGQEVYSAEAIRNMHVQNTGVEPTPEQLRYPAEIPIPEGIKALKLQLPFPPGVHVEVPQGNNSMGATRMTGELLGGTHSPKEQSWPGNLRWAIDFAVPDRSKGAPIVSAAAGVAHVFDGASPGSHDHGGFGNMVIVDHGNGYGTLYSHLDAITVRPGQNVGRGESLGTLGDTGHSGTPHLHFMAVELEPGLQMGEGNRYYRQVVPFDMKVSERGQAPRRIASTEFQSTLWDFRPDLGATYSAGSP